MQRRKRRGKKPRSALNKKIKPIQNSVQPHVSVVIPAMNERRTISRVIYEASKVHGSTEVIVVANGSRDGTDRLAAAMGAKTLFFAEPLGHDVGRAIGAKHAQGNIVLFLDGDVVIPAKHLVPLVRAVEAGADVALNKYIGPVNRKKVHSVILAKHALNMMLSRPDLKGVSLTTIPHAMSRKAISMIGVEHLTVPPLAHSIAIHKGLKVVDAHYIEVGRTNPIKRKKRSGKDPLESLIVGDHLEAVHWLASHTNERGNFTDLGRDRKRVR